jgi:hypothetical protein
MRSASRMPSPTLTDRGSSTGTSSPRPDPRPPGKGLGDRFRPGQGRRERRPDEERRRGWYDSLHGAGAADPPRSPTHRSLSTRNSPTAPRPLSTPSRPIQEGQPATLVRRGWHLACFEIELRLAALGPSTSRGLRRARRRSPSRGGPSTVWRGQRGNRRRARRATHLCWTDSTSARP